MKQISIILIGFAAAFAVAPALAEDLTAGKTPAQLFRSDCSSCHRSPNGLVSERDVPGLAAFLREHYTTKSETAASLAAYVSSLASDRGAGRSRGVTLPGHGRARGRRAPAGAAAVPADVRPGDETGVRRGRRTRDDGAAPRPPRDVGTAAPSGTRSGRPHHAIGSESAERARAPKAHKRRRNVRAVSKPDDKPRGEALPPAVSEAPAAAPPGDAPSDAAKQP